MTRRLIVLVVAVTLAGCLAGRGNSATVRGVRRSTAPRRAVVGEPFAWDAASTGASPFGRGRLQYAIALRPAGSGLTVDGSRVRGVPTAPGIVTALVDITDARGRTARDSVAIVAFAPALGVPVLPSTPYPYADSVRAAVARLVGQGAGIGGGRGGRGGGRGGFGGGRGGTRDNTPDSNAIADAGATLGRVLFYDKRLSGNDRVACASCHVQAFGFSDTARVSQGFAGGHTARHSMGLTNARFYASGRFFWDERASTLEAQVLTPVQDPVEMGMALPALEVKLAAAGYYQALFRAAFGSPEITSDRIARALAQFVRSLVSSESRFDRGPFADGGMTAQERDGLRLFTGPAGCARCHVLNTLAGDGAHNTGLDASAADSGAGRGRFKVPSLRNVAVRPPYMHDGRFATLEQVVEHYDSGVQAAPALDQRLRGRDGAPRSLGLTGAQKTALVAYLHALTDSTFLTDRRFADPFVVHR